MWSPARSAYSASKHALRGFFNSLRCEEPDIQITVVYPGACVYRTWSAGYHPDDDNRLCRATRSGYVYSEIHDRARTIGGKKLEREASHFMPVDTACDLILEGMRKRSRDYSLTWSGVFGVRCPWHGCHKSIRKLSRPSTTDGNDRVFVQMLFGPMMPSALDRMAIKKAQDGVKNWQ